MASSPLPEIRAWRAPGGLHLVLSVVVPTVSADLAAYWLAGLSPLRPAAWAALGFTIVMALWAPWRQRTHRGALQRLWVWSVLNLGYYGLNAALTPGPWPAVFAFEGAGLIWWAAGFVQGQVAAFWASQLAPRARLFQLLEGVPEGKQLEDRVHDFQVDADFSQGNRTALEASLVVFGTLAVALACGTDRGSPGTNLALLGAFLAGCLLLGVLLRGYRREMEALMYGHRLTWGDKLAPLGWSALLLVLSGAAGALLVSLGGPWFDWSVLQSKASLPPDLPPAPAPAPPPDLDHGGEGNDTLTLLLTLAALLLHLERLAAAVQLLGWLLLNGAPWAAGAFLVWPLVRWFLRGGRDTRGLLRRWRRLLVLQIRDFLAGLAHWRRALAPGSSLPLGAGSPGDWVRSWFQAPAPGSRRPYPEVVQGFLKIVAWSGESVPYRAGETTREYLGRSAAAFPAQAADLLQARDLLDEELFGHRGLDSAGRDRFRRLVLSITAVPPVPPPPGGVS